MSNEERVGNFVCSIFGESSKQNMHNLLRYDIIG
jgi:hypothetical protein